MPIEMSLVYSKTHPITRASFKIMFKYTHFYPGLDFYQFSFRTKGISKLIYFCNNT